MRETAFHILLLTALVSFGCGQEICDNAPVECSSCPVFTEGRGAVNLLNGTGLELSDADSESGAFPSLRAALVELQTDTPADTDSVTLTVNDTVCQEYGFTCTPGMVSGRAVLNITGNQSLASYEKVLVQVKFNITAEEPVLKERLVALKVSDGKYWSDPAIIVVAVNGINDNPPIISVVPRGRPFEEENSLGVDVASSVSISDVDDDVFVEARVTILNVQDDGYEWLSTYNLTVYDISVTDGPTLVVTGNKSSATYSTILRSIRYYNNASEPNATARTIQFTINDGMFSSSDIVNITILPRNDNPSMINVSALPNFTEGGKPLNLFNNTLNLCDADSVNSVVYIQSFTAILIGGTHNESLMAADTTNISQQISRDRIVFSGNYTIDEYQMAVRSIVYVNSGDELSCPLHRTINLTIEDGMHINNVTQVMFYLNPINNKAPEIILQNIDVIFTEGSSLGVVVFPSLTIIDDDEQCKDNMLQFAHVTLHVPYTEDEYISIMFCDELDGSGSGIYQCDPVDLGVDNVTMTMDNGTSPFRVTRQIVNDNIRLTITGEAPLEVYQDLLQLVFYNNSADEPELGERTVSLLVDDGDNSSMVETNITVMPLADNRPVINPDEDPTMTENMGPVSIIYDITDADQLDEHQLIHQINISLHNASGNVRNEDILVMNGTISDSGSVSVNCSDCQDLDCCVNRVQGVMYNNTADEPLYPYWRIFAVQIKAAGITLYSPLKYYVNISIELVNDNLPIIQVNGSAPADEIFCTEFTEGSSPVLIFDNPRISDGDVGSNFITSVTIAVDDEGDMNNTLYDWFMYDYATNFTINNTLGLLEISGAADCQEYKEFLSSVRYFNKLDEPYSMYQRRNVTVIIREDNQSSVAYIVVKLIPVNDPAQFSFSNKTIVFYEDTREPVMLFDSTDVINDPDEDAGNLTNATLTLWPIEHEGDTLSINSTEKGSPLDIYCNGTYIHISGIANITVYEDILRTATFVNRRFDSPSTLRQVIVNTFDGIDDGIATISIMINITDDLPVCFFGRNIEQSTLGATLQFVECEGTSPCGTNLCPEEASCFNITDFDSNDTFPEDAVAIVTITNAFDAASIGINKREGIIFPDNYSTVVMEVDSPLFMVQYEISNVSTYTELTQVLRSAIYNNTVAPLVTGLRTINISINVTNRIGPQQCQVTVNVTRTGRLRTVLPSSLLSDPVLTYIEDSIIPVIPESLQENFSFTVDDGFNTGYRVTLTIVNGSSTGELLLPDGFTRPDVSISGVNTSQITVEYLPTFSDTAPVGSFNDIFRAVKIIFEDQAPRSCVRGSFENCAVLEFVNLDILEAASHVTRLYVAIKVVNDQPVLMRLRNNSIILDDYLPPKINTGFNTSFLVTEDEVMDVDRAPYSPDIVGLAIVNVTDGVEDSHAGVWQYRSNSTTEWFNIMNASECYPVFIPPEGFIRFYPAINPDRSDANVTVTVRAWDGTSRDTPCTNGVDHETLPVSNSSEVFTYQLVYLNRAPFTTLPDYNITTNEDIDSDPVNVSTIVMALGGMDPEGAELGLVVVFVNGNNDAGYWQYQSDIAMDSWMNIPYNITADNAFLLLPTDVLRFSPADNYFGSSYITVLAATEVGEQSGDRIVNTSCDNSYTGSYSVLHPSNISVTVIGVLDPPILDCETTEITYTENAAPVYIFEGLNITSIETDELESATIKLSTEEEIIDILHYPNTSNFDVIDDEDPHCIMINAMYNNSIKVFQHFLRQISFSIQNDTEIEPGIQIRTVSLTVTDSFGTNSSKAVDISITLINDHPPSISLPEDNVTFIEDTGQVQLFVTPPNITDLDDNPHQRSVIDSAYLCLFDLYDLDDDNEWLSFNNGSLYNSIMGSFDGYCLLLNGTGTIEEYEKAFTRVYYHNNISEPTDLQRKLDIRINDGSFYSYLVNLCIDIMLVNDQPPAIQLGSADMNNSIIFTEGLVPVFIAPQAIITDEDSDSNDSISYSLHVQIINPNEDEVIFRDYPTNGSANFSIAGPTSIEYIQQALRELLYINGAIQPMGSYRLLRVDVFDIYDESGSAFMDTAYVRVDFTFTDDLPQFNFNITAILYQEGDGPVRVASSLTIVDVDDTEISSAVIKLSAGNIALNFSVEIINIDQGLLNGTNISLSQSYGRLILNGTDRIETYEQILRTLTYEYTIAMGNPVEGKRVLQGYVEGIRVNTTSDVDTLAICFTSIDNSPIVDLNGAGVIQSGQNYSTEFMEEGDPVAIASDAAFIEDVDSPTLQYINITLTNPIDGNEEGIMLMGYYNHSVQYNMKGPLSTFSEVLRNVTYINTADEPAADQRVIIIVASDGSTYSDPVQSTINILLTDDIPQLYLDGDRMVVNYSTTFMENGGPVNLTVAPIVDDSDAINVTELDITISPSYGLLTATVELYMINGYYVYNETTTVDQITEIISSLMYEDNSDEPLPGDRLVCLSITIDDARSNTACTEITLVPEDDSPVRFTMNFSGNVFENETEVNVIQVIAEDDDTVNSVVNITYSIVNITAIPYDQSCSDDFISGSGAVTVDPYPFTIDQASGWISITDSSLDRETYSSYVIVVEATDGEYNDTTIVTIVVEDVDDNCATFYPTVYSVTVPQGAEANSNLVDLVACDPDGDTITTELPSTIPFFGLSGLTLQLLVDERVLVGQNQSTYDVMIHINSNILSVADCNEEIALVRVNVQLNNATPRFIEDSYHVSFPENVVTTSLLQVVAVDDDSGSNADISYSIISNMTSLQFAINSSSGTISVTQTLDFEERSNYSFLISATDQGLFSKSSMVLVEVWVENVNDEPPVFSQSEYTVSVLENVSVPYNLIQVEAFDNDGITITYELTNLDPSLIGLFQIDVVTGLISIVDSTLLDHENFEAINFTVRANDTLNAAEVYTIVRIIDINEAPVFTMAVYNVMINESFTPNMFPDEGNVTGSGVIEESFREIIQVTAIDPDGDDITYNIYPQSYFAINASTGVITSNVLLDREVMAEFIVVVQATDNMNSMGNATVEIVVLDINDNTPTFIPQLYSKILAEDFSIGSHVLYVTVCDLDESSTIDNISIVQYDVPFNLTTPVMTSDGCYESSLLLASFLDYETTRMYSLTIEATDTGTPPLNGVGTISISVSDVNDNPPVIAITYIVDSLLEAAPIGSFIANFTVTDEDSGINADYMILTSNGITAVNGTILLAQQLDYENATYFSFSVTAINVASPNNATTVGGTIMVENVNDVAAVLTAERQEVDFFEGFSTVRLDPGITITDDDSTMLYSATVSFSGISSREPQLFFTPNDNVLPYDCPLEDKFEKFVSCGFNDAELITDSGSSFFNGAMLDGATLHLNASNMQYMVYSGQPNDISNGVSVLFWIRKNSMSLPSVQPILTKGNVFLNRDTFSISCLEDNSLQFSFDNGTAQRRIILNYNCSNLEDYWHHMGIVLRPQNNLWTVTLHIDDIVVDSRELEVLAADVTGQFLIGTDTGRQNFFNGAIHFAVASTVLADGNNDINCAIGCGVILHSMIDTPLYYKYLYNESTLYVSGMASLEMYAKFFNSLYFISTFSQFYSDLYALSFSVVEAPPTTDQPMPLTFNIVLFIINEGTPVLLLDGNVSPNYETSFTEEGPPVSLVNVASLSLTDSDLNPSNYTVSITLLDPLQGDEERVDVDGEFPLLQIDRSHPHYVTISGNTAIIDIENALGSVVYNNIAEELNGTHRIVEFAVDDNFRGQRLTSTPVMTHITFIPVNDPPDIVLQPFVNYTEGDIIDVVHNISIADNDGAVITMAVITLTVFDVNEEEIDIDTNGTDIVAEYSNNNATIQLTGNGKHSEYQQVLTTLTYLHSSENPTAKTRIISIIISDGENSSEPADVMIFFESVNDAPVLDPNGPLSGLKFVTEFVEDVTVAVNILSTNFTLFDSDNSSLAYISLLLVDAPDGDQEFLRVYNDDGFIDNQAIMIDPYYINSSYITVFQEALATAQYVNTAEEPTGGIRNVTFIISDGIDRSVSFACILVIARNDPPQLDLNGNDIGSFNYYTAFVDSGGAIPITSNVIIEDSDNNSVITSFTVYLRNPVDGGMEVIMFTLQSSLNCSYNTPSYIRCNVTGFTTDQVVDILNSVLYNNTNDEPTLETRQVDFMVSDGFAYSNIASAFINISLVNEYNPRFIMADYSVSIEENQPAGTEINITNFRAFDNDNGRDGEISYSIDSGNELKHFSINTTTGVLFANVMLDSENIPSYQLLVVATDDGVPPRNGTVSVQIIVTDLNDNVPQFAEDTIFSLSVSESADINDIIYSISAMDVDGDVVIFTFEGGEDVIGVTMDGRVVVMAGLDADNGTTAPVYTITVTIADDTGSNTTGVFTIDVLDENDNLPTFLFDVYEISVSEGILIGERIGEEINAIDNDVNSNLTYMIANSSTFEVIDGQYLTVAVSLDREIQDQYSFTLSVSDGLNVASTLVKVTVTDINDNAPVFGTLSYNFTISENTMMFSEFVAAVDVDLGSNSDITYSISDPVGDVVQINSVTGEITLSNALDFEAMTSIDFTVYASDGGTPPLNSSVGVTITVRDVNEEAPAFTQPVYTSDVIEGVANITIATVSLSNNDEAFEFSLDDDFDTFTIDATSGEVTAIVSLDYESICTYQLIVTATNVEHQNNGSLLQSTAIVEVFVINVHDVPPVFNQSMYAVSVYENQTAGSLVTVVYATDEDSSLQSCSVLGSGSGEDQFQDSGVLNSELRYSLENYTNLFIINNLTGEITTRLRLDREENMRYSVPVTVTDIVNATDTTIVNIIVLDLNDNQPRFSRVNYSFTVEENMPVGSSVFQVTANDRDMLDNGNLLYTLPVEVTTFGISSVTGVISVSEPIDFESGPTEYNFIAIVHDSASQNDTALIIINIVDINDVIPVISNITSSVTYSEGQVSLRSLTAIVISDDDSFQTIDSAQVRLIVPGTGGAVSGDCRCSDTQNSATCGPMGCTEFLQLRYDFPGMVTLSQLNDSVMVLSLTGTYNISTYTNALRSVEYINVISNPSVEPRTLYVTVNDGSFDSNLVMQNIIIEPFNEFIPVLDLNGINMDGNNFITSFTERGDPIPVVSMDVIILDNDTDMSLDVITAAVVEIINPLDGAMEYLSSTQTPSGDITVQNNVSHNLTLTGEGSFNNYYQILLGLRYVNIMPEPFLTPRRIRFTLRQYQHVSEPVYTTVDIVGVNNHSPMIMLGGDNMQNYQTQFFEGSIGVPITSPSVQIIDMDSGNDIIESLVIAPVLPFVASDRIFFSDMSQLPATITVDSPGPGYLTLNGPASVDDFIIAIRLVYYQSTDDEFVVGNPINKILSVTAADSTSTSLLSFSTIILVPINDQQPSFGLDIIEVNVSELMPVGSVIVTLTAVDNDSLLQPATLYSIVNDSSQLPFYLNATTGELRNIQTLDSDNSSRLYILIVQARDAEYNGIILPGMLTLSIFIEDENDNNPFFAAPLYNASVVESVANGAIVTTLTAVDNDVDEVNRLIEYDIINITDFIIDENGNIITNTVLDRERQDFYKITVVARHPDDIDSSGTALLNIYILDVNDNDHMLNLIPNSGALEEPTTMIMLSTMLNIMDNDLDSTLDYATVKILPSTNTPPLGQLLSLHNTPAIVLTGNNSQVLRYTGEGSIQEYERLLRSIMYRDDAAEPIPVTRLVEYTVSSQNVTATSVFNLSVVVINDNPPYLTLDSTNSTGPGDLSDVTLEGAYFTAFIEEGDPIYITSQFLDIIDIDSGFGNLSYAIVYIKDSRDEQLIVNLTDSIQLSVDSNDTWLNLTGPAAIEDFEDSLRSIRYVNLADEPMGELKEVLFYVNDGKFDSNFASAYVTISTRNDAPVITLGQDGTVDISLMYLEDQSEPLLPAQYIRINDAENDPITIVTIIINNKLPEETLTISPMTSDLTIFDTANGLILLHTAPASEFEVVLRTLEYRNSRTMAPDQLPRMISFTATDSSGLTSEQTFVFINFESVDNPPVIDLNGNFIPGFNFSTVFSEGGSMIPIVSSQASISDIDSEELHLMVISFKNIPDLTAEDIVIQNTTGVMSVQRYRDNNSLCINITGQRPISDYLSVLTSVMYVNMADEPSPVQREILTQVYSIDTNGNLTVSNEVYSLITIAYINDHSPVFSRSVYNGSVLENSPAGTEVNVTVLATDDDRYGGTNITYRLPPEVVNFFVVDPITGIISTASIMLDREVNNSVTFRVLAIDNDIDTRTGTATVTINVLDVNDNPPMFSPLTFTPPIVIPENMSTGVTIKSVTATDPDAGTNGLIIYRVYSTPLVLSNVGSGYSSGESFGVVNDNGVASLSLIASLDRETVAEYIISVEATDSVYTDVVNISVIVSDVNDNAPVFIDLPSSLNISEDASIGTVLYQVTAVDADLNAYVQFSLLTFPDIFTINSTTGVITLSNTLDYEETQEYALTVQAFDSSPPAMTSQEILVIRVSDVNEPPQFDPEVYTVEINENSIVRIALSASDPENDAIFYAFNDPTDLFNINPSTGIISSVDVLDYESQPQINLTVQATDRNNFDIAYIFITLLDVNDNAPVFDGELYSATVSENIPVNLIIVTVTAVDADYSSNGVVTYDIVQGNSDNLFRIDLNNGSIILTSSLDFETATSYNLTVAAVDMGTPALTGTVVVRVNVTDVNDVPPVLTINESLVTYTENSNEVLIATGLEIVDNDSPLHPLMGAVVILDVGVCRLSSDELEEACQQQDPSCLSYCAERLTFDRTLLSRYSLSEPQISTDHMIAINGSAPESYYQEVLRSFAYINLANEPYAGDRIVSFQVTDDQGNTNRVGVSNIINVTVSIQLIDEYCPVISSAMNTATFVEGSNSTPVGQNVLFSVTDRDREPHKMLTLLEITLRDRQTEESISVTENSVLLVNSLVIGSDLTIRVQGAATVELYRQVLETLEYHNTDDEPTLNQRLVEISPFVADGFPCTSYNIAINITPVNDNPPVLTTDVQTVNYTEESGTLMFAQSAGLRLTDPDHNDVFNIFSAEVVLTNVRDGNSEIIGFSATLPDDANIVQEDHRIFINYTASVSAYNSLLRSLTYRDVNPEPTAGISVITITICDGNRCTSTTIIIVILSINDNSPMLQAGNSLVTLTEGTTEFRVGQEAMLILIDHDGEIASLQITLSNRVEQSEEIRISNSTTISSDGTSIFINRTMSINAYQEILNNLVYLYPQATEPLAGNRTITISVSDNNYTSTVSVTVCVELINDNIPVVDLNGPLVDGLSHSTSVVFSIMPSRQAIATPFVNISDSDNDAYINTLEIRLNEESDDSLVFNLTDCYLPQGVDQISCQLKTDPQFSCVCGENLVPSQDLRTLGVYLTQKSIVVMQSRDLVSFETFQYLLANLVWFRHNPTPPTSSYTSVVNVVVFDGQFYSQPANTTVTVQLAPSLIVPILGEVGATNVSVVIKDGTPSIPIAANASIASDDVMLQGMIVTLTNVIHAGEEFLSVTGIEPGITLASRSDENLIFTGSATVQSYATLLQSVSYNYDRMSSLIDHAPDLSPRIIFIEIVDAEGRLSPSGQITLIMDDICRVTVYGDTVTISTMEDFEEISICRGLELDLDIRDPFGTGISSLRPLGNIRFVRKLAIDDVAMLTTLEGLENLESYSSLEIINNYRLTTLRHLSSNHSPLGLTIRNVYISTNMHLQDINGLQHIRNVTGLLQLYSNNMLGNLEGLNNVVQVEDFVIYGLLLITNLNIANSLWKANTITIFRNTALQRITGFQRLREAYSLSIRTNSLLSSIDGFGGILSVFSVTISSNPSLCYILSEIPNTAYWEGLGAQDITVDIGSSCAQRNCSDNPCYNGGQCVTTDGYTCMCSGTGYYNGNDLQGCLFFNACQPEPCLNGGKCVLAELDLLGYRCECPDYFSGPSCELENECGSQRPCVNGACENRSNGYQCFCSLGYTGTNCSINIDDCDPNPCENGGSCTDGIDSYSCTCSTGFTSDTCTVPL